MSTVSKSRAARRRRARYAKRGLPDPARLYELNCRRRLPRDHPSADRKEPIITTAALARRLGQCVDRSGVVEPIDGLLPDHRGEQPVLTTRMLLTTMLLAAKLRGGYLRTVHCAVLAGLDAAVAVEWGLVDAATGESLLTYNMVRRQSQRLEDLLTEGKTTADGTRISLQWMVDRFLASAADPDPIDVASEGLGA